MIAVAESSGLVATFKRVEELQEFLNMTPGTLTGHNFKFDLFFLMKKGLKVGLSRWQHDSQIAAFVSTEKIPTDWLEQYEAERKSLGSHHRKAGQHSLKTLAPYFLNVEPFWEVENHASAEYALKDARYTLELTKLFEEKLRAADQIAFYERLMSWTKMILRAELRGIEVDTQALKELEKELHVKSIELEAQLEKQWSQASEYLRAQAIAEVEEKFKDVKHRPIRRWHYEKQLERAKQTKINLNSPKQLLWLLRDFLGYDVQTFAGTDSTGKEVLQRLSEEGADDVKTYLQFRKVSKLQTAFLPTIAELTNNQNQGGHGRLHPIYNVTGARTGRLSCERPNVQQVPQELKQYFRAREGFSLIGYDLAAIEPRLIALYTNDPTLYELVKQGISIHDYTTQLYFEHTQDVPVTEIKHAYPKERKAAKEVGLALFYGAGARQIQAALQKRGYQKTEADCKRLLYRFRDAFQTAFKFKRELTEHLEMGEHVVNLFGRPIKIQDPQDAYMKGFNTLVQSSASDLLIEGAFRASQEFRKRQIDGTPVLFVHDFLGVEVDDEQAQEADEIIRRSLTDFNLSCSLGPIPLEVEGGTTKFWT